MVNNTVQGIGITRIATRVIPPTFVAATPAPKPVVGAIVKPTAGTAVAAVVAKPVQVALTPQVGNIRMIDPAIASKISLIWFPPAGVPRDQLTVPVSPTPDVTDATVLEDPKNASKKYYIAGYKLQEQTTTAGKEFVVRMLATASGWELRVSTVKVPAAAVLQANPGAQEAPHQVALLLRYRQRVNGQPAAVGEAAFTSVSTASDGVSGILAIDNLSKRDEIYRALTDLELECKLVVRRKAQVAVPVPPTPPPAPPPRPPGVMVSMVMMKPAPPGPTLYRQTERVLDLEIPFTFDPNLHRGIFEGVGAVSVGSQQGLVRRQIAWKGQQFVYYHDESALNCFYYLPDTFKLGRRPAAPHQPLMSMRFDSPDGSREKMQATVSYCAIPIVNRERLTSALPDLKALVPKDILQAAGGIELEPLLTDPASIKLKLSYPGADVQGGPFAVRPQASADLRAGIVDALTLNLDQVRALYDAMFSSGQLLFTGVLEFQMGGVGEQIPFQLRMFDTAEPFASWVTAGTGDDVVVTLKNEIESTLRVHQLDAIFSQDSNITVKPLDAAAGAYPIEIPPAGSANFRLPHSPAASITDLDFSAAESKPDKTVIYNLILDSSTPPAYLRPITVKTFDRTFKADPNSPQTQVMSVVVDFEDGATVELTADKLQVQNVNIPVPVSGFVAGQEETQSYRYKLTVARLNGVTTDPTWRSGDSGLLFVVLP